MKSIRLWMCGIAAVAAFMPFAPKQADTLTFGYEVYPVLSTVRPRALIVHSVSCDVATQSEPLTSAEMFDVVAEHWPLELVGEAMVVACCESGWNPRATYRGPRDDSHGLFQINRLAHRHSVEALRDPEYNAEQAWAIYARQGWRAWRGCRR